MFLRRAIVLEKLWKFRLFSEIKFITILKIETELLKLAPRFFFSLFHLISNVRVKRQNVSKIR